MAPQFYRSRQGLVIALVGALILVAGVVTFALLRPAGGSQSADQGPAPGEGSAVNPGVVDPPVTMRPLALGTLEPDTPAPTPTGTEAALAWALGQPGLGQFNGYIVDPLTGTVLLDRNAGAPQSPASTMKLLSGAGVLTVLEPQSRLVTRVVQGDEPGTVVFVGGGDITLSARTAGTQTVYDGAAHIADLARQVMDRGVQVDRIVLDTTHWTGQELAPGWQPSDIGDETRAGYITRMQPLMVDGDRYRPAIRDSGRTGDPAVNAGRALALALGVPDAEIVPDGQAPDGAQVLGQVSSQPVSVLLAQALENSDNVLAEALAREVAFAMGGAPSFDGVSAALQIILEDLGFDTTGVRIADASGLSTLNEVPTRLLAQILAAAVTADSSLRNLIIGLPVAGASGTLADRFAAVESAGGRGWIRAKTGSLGLTYALAGVVLTTGDRILVFSFISNRVDTTTRPALDALAAALRSCGCA